MKYKIVISVDQAVSIKSNFKTPFKSNSSTLDSSSNLDSSFVADEKSILSTNTLRIPVQQIDQFLLLVCTRVDSLSQQSELIRSTFNTFESSVVDDLDKPSSRISLLNDNIGQNPGITDFLLRNPWKGISFLKYFFAETVSKILPVVQNMTVSLCLQQGQLLLAKSLQSPVASLSSLQSSLSRIDGILSTKFPPLERLYATCLGEFLQPPAAALASRLNNFSARISSVSVYSVSPLGSPPLPPPSFVFSTRINLLEATVI